MAAILAPVVRPGTRGISLAPAPAAVILLPEVVVRPQPAAPAQLYPSRGTGRRQQPPKTVPGISSPLLLHLRRPLPGDRRCTRRHRPPRTTTAPYLRVAAPKRAVSAPPGRPRSGRPAAAAGVFLRADCLGRLPAVGKGRLTPGGQPRLHGQTAVGLAVGRGLRRHPASPQNQSTGSRLRSPLLGPLDVGLANPHL